MGNYKENYVIGQNWGSIYTKLNSSDKNMMAKMERNV